MPRKAKELGALVVSRLNAPGRHAVGGVDGLALKVSDNGARSWVLRYMAVGDRREMGLGSFPSVTLADAREAARRHRASLGEGGDPIDQRQAARRAAVEAKQRRRTFAQCSEEFLKVREHGWKNAKHAQQWRNTLEVEAKALSALPVHEIETHHVLRVLEPIWATKTVTASRLRGRIELVLRWAESNGYRSGPNPARWKGGLENALPNPKAVKTAGHHAALPYADVPAFMVKLRAAKGTGARALEFAILTAARSGEVRGATWSEIDLDGAEWRIPGTRMKGGRDHYVPLNAAALKLLKSLPPGKAGDFLFPGRDGKRALSDMTLTKCMRDLGADATPHGCRSSFRDWAGEQTAHPREVIEHALAHQLPDKTEAAYHRGTLLPKRQRLMADWGEYLARPVTKNAKVVPIRKGA